MTAHQWIQIKKPSYPIINDIVRSPLAERSDDTTWLTGVRSDITWRLTTQAEVAVLSDEHLSIAGRPVAANLTRFSTHMYQALVAASPRFTQHQGLDELYQQVRQPQEGWNAAAFARQLEETVRAGRQPDPQPRLVGAPTTYRAQWKADQIYLRQDQAGDWFLALCFDVEHIPGPRHASPVPMGLDLGLRPLTVACTEAGETETFQLSSLEHLRAVDCANLTPGAQRLLAILAYASGRDDARQVVAYLGGRASRVYAEHLNLRGMQLGYVQTARATAINDHHFSDLPQSMYAAGILFKRVPPYYTSRRCARCYVETRTEFLGTREGSQLTCPNCKTVYNCHDVASWNVVIDGEERRLAKLRR